MVQRIERLEALLFESTPNSNISSPEGKDQAADEHLTKQLSTLVVNDPGDSHYWGAVVSSLLEANQCLCFCFRLFIRFLAVFATRIGMDI